MSEPGRYSVEIITRALAGQKPAEIRRGLGLSKGTVSGVLWRARNRLRATGVSLANKVRGSQHPRAQMTEEQVLYVRRHVILGSRTLGIKAMARQIGVSPTTLYQACNYDTWRHVP